MFAYSSGASTLDVEMTAAGMNALVSIMYRGECDGDVTMAVLLQVLSFCHKYAMTEVQAATQSVIERGLGIHNALAVYRWETHTVTST